MEFSDLLLDYTTYKMRKITQKPHPKSLSHDWVTEPLQVINTYLMGPISPTLLGNISYIAKFTDVYSKFSALCFLKNETIAFVLDRFIRFERDLAIPFGSNQRQKKREAEEADKVEVAPGVTVASLRRFRTALIGPTQGLPKRRRLCR